ncbi:MAG: NADH-quinone oxidoreductase subunit C [Planctomycetota bacterium]
MDFDAIADRIETRCPGAVLGRFGAPSKDPYVRVAPARLVEVMQVLRDDAELGFEMVVSIAGVDWQRWEPRAPRVKKDEAPPPEPEQPPRRFDVVYHLLAVHRNLRLVVRCACDDDDAPAMPTLTGLYPSADWHERETWDLMGIDFTGHPDQRRILCCEDWVGHPLRKDYEFPKEYHGISAE